MNVIVESENIRHSSFLSGIQETKADGDQIYQNIWLYVASNSISTTALCF